MKFSIRATIPIKSYGSLSPTISVERKSYEDALEYALPKMEALWQMYVDDGQPLKRRQSTLTRLSAFVGGEIEYDAEKHQYWWEGERYTSGSEFAHQFEKPFMGALIAGKMAKKAEVDPQDIIDMWGLKADISRGLGTALHGALELYGKYKELGLKTNTTTYLHDSPMIMKAVKSFFDKHPEPAYYEPLIVDHTNKRAGRIDRLTHDYWIEDYKTDVKIEDKLPIYQKQLSFYAAILESNNIKAKGLRVHHWNGIRWKTYKLTKEKI